MKLLGYDFFIEYKPGKENRVADALSRQHEGDLLETVGNVSKQTGTLSCTTLSVALPSWLEVIKQAYTTNEHLLKLKQQCADNKLSSRWELRDDILFYKHRIYLTSQMDIILIILKEFHDGTHEGIQKTLKRLRAVFFWSRVHKDVMSYFQNLTFVKSSRAPR